MFQLDPAPTFEVVVPISAPGKAAGLDLAITYRHKRKTALAEWIATARGRTDVEILGEVIEGWSGMHNRKGEDVPYSSDALGALLENYPAAKDDLFNVYFRELTEDKRKH